MHPFDLRCEYRSNPLGLDVTEPRLSWKLAAGRQRGARQTAYQVLVAASAEALAAGCALLWDSGRVGSGESAQVDYAGQQLASRQRAWWQVRAWDESGGATPLSAPASAWWEMGLLERADWRAEWIGAGLVGGPLTWARASYESPYGRIHSAWRRTEHGLEWQVTLPPNSTATAYVPAAPGEQVLLDGQPVEGVVLELGAGSYEFVIKNAEKA